MKKKKVSYPMGTISSGTHRVEDLIPRFANALGDLAQDDDGPLTKKIRSKHLALEGRVPRKVSKYENDTECKNPVALVELCQELEDALDMYSAPYFYFGAHPGDGADFGFWLPEGFEESFDGLRVSDLAEVPKLYEGEVLVVNDRGNTSLYEKRSGREPRVVWELV